MRRQRHKHRLKWTTHTQRQMRTAQGMDEGRLKGRVITITNTVDADRRKTEKGVYKYLTYNNLWVIELSTYEGIKLAVQVKPRFSFGHKLLL